METLKSNKAAKGSRGMPDGVAIGDKPLLPASKHEGKTLVGVGRRGRHASTPTHLPRLVGDKDQYVRIDLEDILKGKGSTERRSLLRRYANQGSLVLLIDTPVDRREPDASSPQRRLAAKRLVTLMSEFGLSSLEVAANAGLSLNNPSAGPTRWVREGKIIMFEMGPKRFYPAFQFDPDTGKPLRAMKKVIGAYGPSSGTALSLWFVAANAWLDGARPADVIRARPRDVIAAATKARQQVAG